MAISFLTIPLDVRTPGVFVEVDPSRAVRGTPPMPNTTLAIGQRLSTGSVAAGVLTLVPSPNHADDYFGVGSILAMTCKAFLKARPTVELWAIALDDAGGGVQATGNFTYSGTATEAGEIAHYIHGVRIPVAVANGDSAATVETAAVAAATAVLTRLAVTVAASAGTALDLTARNAGTLGNEIDIRVNYYQGEQTPAGLTVVVNAMASGATDPTLQTALDAVPEDAWFPTVICPYNDATSLSALETWLAARWGGMVQKYAHSYTWETDTVGNLTTLGNSRNSPHLTIVGTPAIPTTPWEAAAIAAAVDAAEPDPARPRQTLELPGVLPPAAAVQFTRAQRDTLLRDGIATTKVLGGKVLIERLITTYQVNAQAIPDVTFLDVTTMRTLMRLRFDVQAMASTKWARHKLASDGPVPTGQPIVTPKKARAAFIALFDDWVDQGLVEAASKAQFVAELVCERDANDVNRLNVLIPADIVNGLRVVAAQIQFIL